MGLDAVEWAAEAEKRGAGEILLTYIEKYYRKRAFFANKDTQFAIASLGNDAGICGAAKLILDSQV